MRRLFAQALSLLRGQCASFVTARSAIRCNEPVVVHPEYVDAPLGRPSVIHSADRPPSARLSLENDAHRAERLPALLLVRPQFSPRSACPTPANAEPEGPQRTQDERVRPSAYLTSHWVTRDCLLPCKASWIDGDRIGALRSIPYRRRSRCPVLVIESDWRPRRWVRLLVMAS
jgi:hypothetical protein